MQTPTIHDELAAFGLSDLTLVASGEFELRQIRKDGGLGFEEALALLQVGVFSVVGLSAVKDAGFQVARSDKDPHHLQVTALEPIELETRHHAPSVQPEKYGQKGVRFDLGSAGSALVKSASGRTLLLVGRGGSVEAHVLDVGVPVQGDELSLFEDGPSPLVGWCADLADDWMQTQLASVTADNPLGHLYVVARFARLVQHEPVDRPKAAALDWLLKSTVDAPLARPRRWARAWSADQRDLVLRWVLGDVEAAHHELDLLLDEDDPLSASWRRRLLGVLRLRDDLQGVALLLEGGGSEPEVSSALADLDERGEDLLAEYRGECRVDDEQIHRARELELDGPWWVGFSKEA